jgi:transposase
MRGGEVRSGSLFSYVDLEARVPRCHPLRTILTMVDAVLARLDGDFEVIYAPIDRPSIPPEQLLRALLLQAFYTVRSERQLIRVVRMSCIAQHHFCAMQHGG